VATVEEMPDQDSDPIVVPTPPGPPSCCGEAMVSIGNGCRANFEIEVWRCLACERTETTFVRVDGKSRDPGRAAEDHRGRVQPCLTIMSNPVPPPDLDELSGC
jgi:hypothetical protein